MGAWQYRCHSHRFCANGILTIVGVALLAALELAAHAERPDSPQLEGHDAHEQVKHAGEIAPKARRLLEFRDATICSLAGQAANLYFVKGPGPQPPPDIFDTVEAKADRSQEKASHEQIARFELWRLAKVGGEPTCVLRESSFESAPAFDQEFVYFLGHNGDLRRASLRGDPTVTLVKSRSVAALAGAARTRDGDDDVDVESSCSLSTAGLPRLPETVVVDTQYVFWLDIRRGALLRVSKLGGRPSLMAKGVRLVSLPGQLADYARLAQDDRAVYFITDDGRDARLMMVDKKRPGATRQVAHVQESPLRFAVGAAGVIWVDHDEVVCPYGATTFHLRSRQSRVDDFHPAWNARRCDFVGDGEGVVSSECGSGGSVLVQSPSKVEPSRMVLDGMSLIDIVTDSDAVYFVDVGQRSSPKATNRRAGCCSIWSAPR